MPQRKQPETLAKLCAKLIFTEIDFFCLSSKTQPDWNLQCLPSEFLEEWIGALYKEERLTPKRADILLTCRIKVLNLSRLDGPLTEKDVQVLQVASERCLELNFLKFGGLSQPSEEVKRFAKFLAHFKKLQYLDLSYSSVGDRCLKILGENCKQLRHLTLTGCPVTDWGLELLRVETSGAVGCGTIEYLSICRTAVTIQGVKRFLRLTKTVRVLKWFDTVEALAQLALDDDLDRSFIHPIPLSELSCIQTERQPFIRNHFSLAVFMCDPQMLRNIQISCTHQITDQDILSLRVLVNLTDLHVVCDSSTSVTFPNGIAPLVAVVGKSLVNLSLSRFEAVNLPVLVRFCPTLTYLSLTFNRYVRDEPIESRSNLEMRSLLMFFFAARHEERRMDSFLTEAQLAKILASPTLKKAIISSCPNLTDNVLRKAVDSTRFANLVYLQISNCPSVTKRGIDLLKNDENCISTLCVTDCPRIDLQSLQTDWDNASKEENWDIDLIFKNYFD